MTFEDIQKVNEGLKLTPIGNGGKAKDYVEVNQRIKAFRMLCPGGSIQTEILSNENGVVIMRAVVIDEDGKVLGTGTAYEKEGNGFINKTSYIENCETSAVGRALAMCGIGIDLSVASYEEVANAQLQQNTPQPDTDVEFIELKTRVLKYLNSKEDGGKTAKGMLKHYGHKAMEEMTAKDFRDYIAEVQKAGGEI